MTSAEIRRKFLEFFKARGHQEVPSSPLVPTDDPTLLFTNAGMVQFKRVFQGLERRPYTRAVTCQKCVRAGGKHNDLEQVGHTARHHTFFEMLGNFSFGDYFKQEAIAYAWEWVTGNDWLGIDPDRLYVTVHDTDDDARQLWRKVAGVSEKRIYGLGDEDNFWQMADTGPAGPNTEIYVDLRGIGDWKKGKADLTQDEFMKLQTGGALLEIWNLVFMQYDLQKDGSRSPLPAPSVDTGAGLERIAAVMQAVPSNYDTDLFAPIIERAVEVVGKKYDRGPGGASYRVLADHARAVAILLADGVYPSNEGRGYVLRRILRRAVRHAWLLGRRQPTLVDVVRVVIDQMGDVYPELRQRSKHIIDTTRAEEERFLATIEGGMRRFDELAPEKTTQGSAAMHGTIAGEDAFKLYDTFGFPIDLTELMARERGYSVDIAGFETALQAQRTQSQEERRSKKVGVSGDALAGGKWITGAGESAVGAAPMQRTGEVIAADDGINTFTGYDSLDVTTTVLAKQDLPDGRAAVILRETPFYAESGGQISDRGEIKGEGWSIDVDEVRKVDGRITALGKAIGTVQLGKARATVPRDRRRDTERNHTATHLLHAALRQVLGEHVHQAGSLVEPDRLRFDFAHHGPLSAQQLADVESIVNRGILDGTQVVFEEKPKSEAIAGGAMSLFNEKYGEVVRVVTIPGVSAELCGGTHVRNTAEIAMFKIVSETGIAAGVRRIEAVTGRAALNLFREHEKELKEIESLVRAPAGQVVKRVHALVEERRSLERRLDDAMRTGGGGTIKSLVAEGSDVNGIRIVVANVTAPDLSALQAMGDALREQMESGVGVLAASFDNGKNTMLAVITDDLRDRGLRADVILREIAATAGGKGGGKPHMAQAGIPDAARMASALADAPEIIRKHLAAA